jgi:GMP synthase-like glutamine amidotransferase
VQVLEVPEGATLLASSARCPVEVFALGSNVLCIQGHPEFDEEVVVMLTDNRRDAIPPEELQRRDESYRQLRPKDYSAQLQHLCKAFLKG